MHAHTYVCIYFIYLFKPWICMVPVVYWLFPTTPIHTLLTTTVASYYKNSITKVYIVSLTPNIVRALRLQAAQYMLQLCVHTHTHTNIHSGGECVTPAAAWSISASHIHTHKYQAATNMRVVRMRATIKFSFSKLRVRFHLGQYSWSVPRLRAAALLTTTYKRMAQSQAAKFFSCVTDRSRWSPSRSSVF